MYFVLNLIKVRAYRAVKAGFTGMTYMLYLLSSYCYVINVKQ